MLWTNPSVLKKMRFSLTDNTTTITEFVADLPKLKAAGSPVCLGAKVRLRRRHSETAIMAGVGAGSYQQLVGKLLRRPSEKVPHRPPVVKTVLDSVNDDSSAITGIRRPSTP